ncbi:hypothetical protein WJX81_001043 [Elliptochloris bilobata]|uniref:Exostosin GT47 domain-containing protein n=1 Tax=Elliptochloris bilobata TaxID=381761 RepID=A0AAW1RMN5_9CHLO
MLMPQQGRCFWWTVFLGAVACVHTAPGHGSRDLLHDFNARVYVVELPPKYNTHAIAREGCTEGRFLETLLSNPLGTMLSESLVSALYRNTSALNLEVHMHMQMLYSPLRVLTAEEADVVYVPLYASQLLGAPGRRHECATEWDRRAAAALLAEFWADAPALLPALGAKPHWVQLSEREALFRAGCGGEGGLPLMCHPLAEQVTWATPEVMTAPHPLHGRARFLGRSAAHNNSLAVPYLGRVHRMSMQSRAAALAAGTVLADKRRLAAVAPRVSEALAMTPDQVKLAEGVARVCREREGECEAGGFQDFLEGVEAQRRAWFCVAPPGNTPTSVSLADCFAAGLAVPVLFDEYLYGLLPFADVLLYRDMAAYVPPGDAAAPGMSFLDHLAAYAVDRRAAMLRTMQGVSQALQYAVRPNHLLVRLDRLDAVHVLDDAFTMSFKAVMRRACGAELQGCRARKYLQGVGSI